MKRWQAHTLGAFIVLVYMAAAVAVAPLLSGVPWSAAASLNGTRLPIVMAQAPTLAPGVYTLVDSDTTFASIDRDESTGRIYISYIDRAHSNRAHLTELIGAHLVEVAAPTLADAPAYVPPDSPKDADVAVCAFGGVVYWLTSSREVNAAGEPFKLKLRVVRPGAPVPTPTPAKVPGSTPAAGHPSGTPTP